MTTMTRPYLTPTAPRPRHWLVLLLVSSALASLFGEALEEKRVGLVFEGTYETAEVAQLPHGAKKTQLVAAYEWDYGVRFFKQEDFDQQSLTWNQLAEASQRIGEAALQQAEQRVVRDFREVVEYHLLMSQDRFLSTSLFSPSFVSTFETTLGNQLHVVILDRSKIYVFPATGGKIEKYAGALMAEYRHTPYPVSLEVFLVDAEGFRVIGELSRESTADSPAEEL